MSGFITTTQGDRCQLCQVDFAHNAIKIKHSECNTHGGFHEICLNKHLETSEICPIDGREIVPLIRMDTLTQKVQMVFFKCFVGAVLSGSAMCAGLGILELQSRLIDSLGLNVITRFVIGLGLAKIGLRVLVFRERLSMEECITSLVDPAYTVASRMIILSALKHMAGLTIGSGLLGALLITPNTESYVLENPTNMMNIIKIITILSEASGMGSNEHFLRRVRLLNTREWNEIGIEDIRMGTLLGLGVGMVCSNSIRAGAMSFLIGGIATSCFNLLGYSHSAYFKTFYQRLRLIFNN